MLPWTPPASLSMQQQNQNQQGVPQQNELHSIGMQHQQPQHQQQGGMQFGGQQQQQQQHPQQQQQSQMQQQQQANDLNAANQQGQQPPLMLSQVLHYLQTEWRRYERERNEWEIERGEMRVRCINPYHTVYTNLLLIPGCACRFPSCRPASLCSKVREKAPRT